MTELEKYISDNLDAFNMEPVPDGSRERFMEALASEKRKRRTKIISISFSGIAATLAIFLSLSIEPDISKVLEKHHTRLAEKEKEIRVMVDMNSPEDREMVAGSIRSIIFEAIPLEEQLPEEMTVKEKVQILDEYYNQKYTALVTLMNEL